MNIVLQCITGHLSNTNIVYLVSRSPQVSSGIFCFASGFMQFYSPSSGIHMVSPGEAPVGLKLHQLLTLFLSQILRVHADL